MRATRWLRIQLTSSRRTGGAGAVHPGGHGLEPPARWAAASRSTPSCTSLALPAPLTRTVPSGGTATSTTRAGRPGSSGPAAPS